MPVFSAQLLLLALGRNADCARCPACLVPRADGGNVSCLDSTSLVRVHKDILGPKVQRMSRRVVVRSSRERKLVGARYIWYCKAADVYFTHPPLSQTELSTLYSTYHSQKVSELARPRAEKQFQYVRGLLGNRLPPNATVVEAGCSWGLLLSTFAAPGRKLVCFEPGESFSSTAAVLERTSASRSTLIPGFFDANAQELKNGIDLFLSSHMLEHIGDLCSFLAVLFEKMNPGGFVFSEVPNHSNAYAEEVIGGTFHLTLPTPRSFVAYFYAAGFRLVDLQLVDRSDNPAGNGFHMRSVFMKPLVHLGAVPLFDLNGIFSS
ncbi:S-adenosyl-L-methionine-dependent methyltransferase [Pavlovales sp. CCMP2436]|nr:S-adenosyl-L-methionine-dependent methyltransferase [Pavlovales sp. CCMP2436]|mmetsp:Transcript_35796/g.89311  ORF Transcript_35796/g.89311 Transcript_35796/m.89311 type:complete len:320 (-) Transcript_35796:125-1084(-)